MARTIYLESMLMAMRYPLLSNGILGTSLSITRVSILHIPTCTCTRRSNAMLEFTVPTMHSVQLNHASTCATCSGERWITGYCNNRVVKCKELVRNVFLKSLDTVISYISFTTLCMVPDFKDMPWDFNTILWDLYAMLKIIEMKC